MYNCLEVHSIMNRLKKVLGLERHTPYIKDFFDIANARAAIYLGLVAIAIETWMLGNLVYTMFFSDKRRTVLWALQHLAAYTSLLFTAVLILIYSIKLLKGHNPPRTYGRILNTVFSIVCLGFGIYISYLDYALGEQVLGFVTMVVFILTIVAWRPLVTFIIITLAFVMFYIICTTIAPPTFAIQVNLFTFWLATVIVAFSMYNQRFVEARKDERLERANRRLTRISYFDELTDSHNMNFFASEMEKYYSGSKSFSRGSADDMVFLFLDIEHFKSYNGRYGHAAGNELLRNFANLIRERFPDDLVCRFSDDHFIIFAKDVDIAPRLQVLKSYIQKADSEVRMGLKTGAYKDTDRTHEPAACIDRARYACNSIKKQFDHDYCIYGPAMHTEIHRKQYIINHIEEALAKGYIVPYYQPVVWAEDGSVCGLEALARWNAPKYGLLSPGVFISVLEEYRLIYRLDHYIMERVCQDIAEAHAKGHTILPVSLNFSRLDFELTDDLVTDVDVCCKKYGISKDELHVEVTESALAGNSSELHAALDRFRQLGYALWLDDFGSGYSGLNVLKEYDFDTMKIDLQFLRHFSENEKAQPILRSIVNLADTLGMQTLTEGVETPEASNFLKNIGCQRLQGYLFGKPMPKEELIEKIHSGQYKIRISV